MGYGDISRNNESCPFSTPFLDAMCDAGVRFTDAHSTSAVCTPSRYSILTGRYNWRSTLKSGVIGGYSRPLIDSGRKTVANILSDAGYATDIVGKWHLGMEFKKSEEFVEWPDFDACQGIDYYAKIKNSPIEYGFDYYYGISASLDMPPYVYIENDSFTAVPSGETCGEGKGFWRRGPTAADFVHGEVLDHLADIVMERIALHAAADEPFFIYFPMTAPHTPILPGDRFKGKSGTNEYGDFVLHCDDVVGRIIGILEQTRITDNTIVIYTSDNGCSPMADFPQLLRAGHNPSYVFRGTKADIYEGGHRIPLIIQWPGHIPANTQCDRIVCLSDLLATVVDLLGIQLSDDIGEDSVSNLPLWLAPSSQEVRKDIIHQSIDGSLSIRMGKWKLEMCPGSGGWSFPRPGVDDTSRLPSFQLYDLAEDIGERNNVLLLHPEVFTILKERLVHQILEGRSTPGQRRPNDGVQVWETIRWIDRVDST